MGQGNLLRMEALAQVAAHMLERATWEASNMWPNAPGLPTAEIILVGHCEAENGSRAFRIAALNGSFRETVIDLETPKFFGSGQRAAEKIVEKQNLKSPKERWNPPHIVLAVCHDDNCEDVGGPIQCGRMKGTEFVLDVVRVENPAGRYNYFVGGLDIGGGVVVKQTNRDEDLKNEDPLYARPAAPEGFAWLPQAQTNVDWKLIQE
jgi:hypothetical protein